MRARESKPSASAVALISWMPSIGLSLGKIAYALHREHSGIWFGSECLLKAMNNQLTRPPGHTVVLFALLQVSLLSSDTKPEGCVAPFLQQLQRINHEHGANA